MKYFATVLFVLARIIESFEHFNSQRITTLNDEEKENAQTSSQRPVLIKDAIYKIDKALDFLQPASESVEELFSFEMSTNYVRTGCCDTEIICVVDMNREEMMSLHNFHLKKNYPCWAVMNLTHDIGEIVTLPTIFVNLDAVLDLNNSNVMYIPKDISIEFTQYSSMTQKLVCFLHGKGLATILKCGTNEEESFGYQQGDCLYVPDNWKVRYIAAEAGWTLQLVWKRRNQSNHEDLIEDLNMKFSLTNTTMSDSENVTSLKYQLEQNKNIKDPYGLARKKGDKQNYWKENKIKKLAQYLPQNRHYKDRPFLKHLVQNYYLNQHVSLNKKQFSEEIQLDGRIIQNFVYCSASIDCHRLTQTLYNLLDVNSDGLLDRDDLEMLRQDSLENFEDQVYILLQKLRNLSHKQWNDAMKGSKEKRQEFTAGAAQWKKEMLTKAARRIQRGELNAAELALLKDKMPDLYYQLRQAGVVRKRHETVNDKISKDEL